MTPSGHKFLLILIMLWLPLQGALAAAIPQQCMHENNVGVLPPDVPALSPSTQAACHEMHGAMDADQNAASSMLCDNCAPCHAAGCNAPVPSAVSMIIPDSTSSYAASLNARITLFVPEQPQRPPLV